MFRNCAKAFEDIEIGDVEEFTVTVDAAMQEGFSKLVGDYSPIHMDKEFALNTQFDKNIGYGFLLESFLSRFYGEYLPGGSSICIKQESKFIKPYYVGDIIKVKGRVSKKIYSTKFVEIQTDMYRNETECIFKGSGLVQVLFDEKMLKPLFKTEDKNLYFIDFVKKLRELSIMDGDTVFVHSDIAVFGKLAVRDRKFLLDTLVDVLKECVGKNGTIIMPTFTYSFCKGEVFDVNNSKSTVGILTEHFRNLPEVKRTEQPIFSCAVYGKKQEYYLDVSKDSFGRGSIFEKLHKDNGKILFLGADFHACTYIHYIEQDFKVPYRYIKVFNGITRNSKEEFKDEVSFYARDLDINPILDVSRFKKYLLENKFMSKDTIGYGNTLLVKAADLYDQGKKLLEEDIKYFLKKS